MVKVFVKYLCFVPSRVKHFYFRPLEDDGSGVPRFVDQPVGRNNFPSSFHKCAKQLESRNEKHNIQGRSPVQLLCIKKILVTNLLRNELDVVLWKLSTGIRTLDQINRCRCPRLCFLPLQRRLILLRWTKKHSPVVYGQREGCILWV